MLIVTSLAAAQDGTPPQSPNGATPQRPTPTTQASRPMSKADAKATASRPAATAAATPKPSVPDVKAGGGAQAATAPKLEETRLTLSKWIETQQIISKERNDWQQGKEILQGRIELVGKEVGQLKDRIAQSETAVLESQKKRDALAAQNAQLKEVGAQLVATVIKMEEQVQKLARLAPEGVATKLQPLLQRIPSDVSSVRVSAAERFQNVLGILNELNKANSEITIAYEIRQLADGSSSEVQV
ncbi:MAG: DUF3450 family protein, partial [Chloroflexi bacterium]|nr:DUF3450 family protein [Chloroflexota bacterium]